MNPKVLPLLRVTLAFVICAFTPTSPLKAETPAAPTGKWVNRPFMGINLDFPRYYGPVTPFADLMKQAQPWIYGGGQQGSQPVLDELGNWKPEPGRTVISRIAMTHSRLPGGVYVVTWEGRGRVQPEGKLKAGRVTRTEANRMELELAEAPDITLEIVESDPADPVRNLRCWLPGLENAKSPFNPAFLEHLPLFGTIRFMDWMHTNGSIQQTWAKRPILEQQTFSLPDRLGVPLELMIDLANLLQAEPWFCTPHMADDDYVRQFASLTRERLDPALRVYLEYSNEIWNTAPHFGQTKWAAEQGIKMGVDPKKTPDAAWYAKRSLEIWKIWEEIYGGRERHVRVLAGRMIVQKNTETKLAYLGDPKLADAIAVANYGGFSRDIKTGNFEPAGRTAKELLAVINEQIDSIAKPAILSNVKLARDTGLRLIGYELGMATGTPQKFVGDKAAVDLFSSITQLPEMEQTMERYLRLWYDNVGDLACLFAYVNRPNQYGSWGNMGTYLGQPDSDTPRRRAILRLAADPLLIRK